jgi:hypothetical protein
MPKNFFITFWILFFICLFGGCLYFVGGVSATFPPIRTYNYQGSPAQLVAGIKNLSHSDTGVSYEITSTVGSADIGLATYMTVMFKTTKRNIEYELKYESEDSHTKIGLIKAYDQEHNIGGYGIKATGMNEILKVFEKDFLEKLKIKQGIVLIHDTSFWTNFSIY